MNSKATENNMNTLNQMESGSEESDQNYQRTLEDVSTVLKYAKIDKSNLTEVSQALYFPVSAEHENFFLIELNSDLMKEIESGETMEIKGGLHEKAVLCTREQTFDIKVAEISNSLLLIPNLKLAQATSSSPIKSPQNASNRSMDKSLEEDEEDETEEMGSQVIPFKDIEKKVVTKVYHEYFECTQIKPRYRKTVDLLKLTLYSGPENEHTVQRKYLFTFNKLLDTAQSSKKEFEDGLKQARAINIDGFIRKLDDAYECRCIGYMLNLIDENSWKLNEIDEDATIELLKEIIPEEVLLGLFELYTEESDIPGKFRYRDEMISRIIITKILMPGAKFNYNEFMQTWKGAMPEGMIVNENHLRGIGVIDKSSQIPTVFSLKEENLSTNLLDRLKHLFKVKPKWTLEEMEPYIEFFTTPTHKVSTILAKHARSLVENGVRIYVSRH